jgi:hypothetical protein
MRSPAAVLAILAAGAALGACSGDDAPRPYKAESPGSEGDQLAASKAAELYTAERTLGAACGPTLGEGQEPGRPGEASVRDAVTTVVAAVRTYRDERYEIGNNESAPRVEDAARTIARRLARCGRTAEAERITTAADG